MVAQLPYRSVLLFGPPGAGKGTQGKILQAIPGFFHLSMGEIFRALEPGSNLGREVNQFTSVGELVPNELTLRVWRKAIQVSIDASRYNPETEILVLDGIPRNQTQTQLIQSTVEVLRVINLVCDDTQLMIDRIKRRAFLENRSDDVDEQVVFNRFENYCQETKPVLDCYPSELVAHIEAVGTPAGVMQRILKIVVPLQQRTGLTKRPHSIKNSSVTTQA